MNEVKWVTVAQMRGITRAEMLANRLKAEGIPARATQEGAGVALGLTVGALGTAAVVVPAQHLAEAREILDVEPELDEEDVVTCPHCATEVEVDEAEWEQGWFRCPGCDKTVDLQEIV